LTRQQSWQTRSKSRASHFNQLEHLANAAVAGTLAGRTTTITELLTTALEMPLNDASTIYSLSTRLFSSTSPFSLPSFSLGISHSRPQPLIDIIPYLVLLIGLTKPGLIGFSKGVPAG
jgi:hypothetical protein